MRKPRMTMRRGGRADTHTSCQGSRLAGHMISLLMVHIVEVRPTLTPYRQPTEPVHEYPTRRLQLRAASPDDSGLTIAHLHVPVPGGPAPLPRRAPQPGA